MWTPFNHLDRDLGRAQTRPATVLSGPLGYTEEPTPLLSGGSAEESTRMKELQP